MSFREEYSRFQQKYYVKDRWDIVFSDEDLIISVTPNVDTKHILHFIIRGFPHILMYKEWKSNPWSITRAFVNKTLSSGWEENHRWGWRAYTNAIPQIRSRLLEATRSSLTELLFHPCSDLRNVIVELIKE